MMLLPVLALGGCGLGSFQQAEPHASGDDMPPPTTGTRQTLTPQSDPPLERLPIPINFDLYPRDSHRYHTDQGRVLLHVYRGPATKDEVERFYRHVMPLTGWEYQGSQMVEGAVELRFKQDEEWADITILDRWTVIGGKGSEIRAKVQTLAPPDKRQGPRSGRPAPPSGPRTGDAADRPSRNTGSRTGGYLSHPEARRAGRDRVAR